MRASTQHHAATVAVAAPHLLTGEPEAVAVGDGRVRSEPRSLPASGSEKPWHHTSSPRTPAGCDAPRASGVAHEHRGDDLDRSVQLRDRRSRRQPAPRATTNVAPANRRALRRSVGQPERVQPGPTAAAAAAGTERPMTSSVLGDLVAERLEFLAVFGEPVAERRRRGGERRRSGRHRTSGDIAGRRTLRGPADSTVVSSRRVRSHSWQHSGRDRLCEQWLGNGAAAIVDDDGVVTGDELMRLGGRRVGVVRRARVSPPARPIPALMDETRDVDRAWSSAAPCRGGRSRRSAPSSSVDDLVHAVRGLGARHLFVDPERLELGERVAGRGRRRARRGRSAARAGRRRWRAPARRTTRSSSCTRRARPAGPKPIRLDPAAAGGAGRRVPGGDGHRPRRPVLLGVALLPHRRRGDGRHRARHGRVDRARRTGSASTTGGGPGGSASPARCSCRR